MALDENGIAQWTRYLLGRGSKPLVGRRRLRTLSWQFFYPKNEVIGLYRDIVGYGVLGATILGFILLSEYPTIGVLVIFAGVAGLIVAARRRKITINADARLLNPEHCGS
jgi:hypothetical protein